VKYTYHILTSGPDYVEVFPSNRPKTSEVKYGVEEFSRMELDMFKMNKSENPTVFATLETWWDDSTYHGSDIFFEVYRGPRAGTPKYKGIFGVADGAMDKDRGIYEIKPRTNDDYRPIIDNYDTAYSTLGVSQYDDLEYHDIQSVTFVNGLPSSGFSFNSFDWSNNVLDVEKTSTDTERGCRSSSAISMSASVPIIMNYAYVPISPPVDNPRVELRDSSGTLKSNTEILLGGSPRTITLSPVENGDFYICFYGQTADSIDCEITISSIYIRNRDGNTGNDLRAFLSYWLYNKMDSGFTTVKSTFFFNDAVSSDCPGTIDTYINANPTHNYVTGAANKLNDTFVAAKWKLISPTKNKGSDFSLSDIMSWLRLFNAYWYIDADGDFRVEHKYWFDMMHSPGVNLTTYESGIYLRGSNTFTWEKDKSYHRETWELVESENTDFVGEDITYSTSETYPQTKETRLTVSTDWPYFWDNISSASVSEFMLLHCTLDSGYYVIQNETGILSSASQANGHFSLANLHDAYHRHGRMAQTGTLNGSGITFESWHRFKLQKHVRFLYASDVNFTDEITTDEGVGWIKSITRHLITDLVEIELLHDAYAPAAGSALLQETGDYILQEDGFKILL